MTNLQYAIMEAYRDNLLSPEVTVDMLEATQGELGPNVMTNLRLKKVKRFEDEVVAPAKNSNWWTSEHTAKVNAYLNKIKALYIGKSLNPDSTPRVDAAGRALNGLRVAIMCELPANKFKFVTSSDDYHAYSREAMKIKAEKDYLMSVIKEYPEDTKLYREHLKMSAKDPDVRKDYEWKLKETYHRKEVAKKKLASKYGIHVA